MLRLFGRSDHTRRPAETGFAISPGVKASVHGDGVVFLHSSKGSVFSANRVGASIWEGVCAGRTPEQISVTVSRDFQAPQELVAGDIARFLAELQAEGILVRRSG